MNPDRLDPALERLLSGTSTSRAPDRLRLDIAEASRRTRQRPAWLTSLKETPMRYRSRVVVGSPTARLAAAMIATAILTLAIAGAVIAGSSPQPSQVAPETPRPTWVTGSTQPVDGTCTQLGVTGDGDVAHYRFECDEIWTASDLRLTGDVSRPWNEDVYRTDDGTYAVTLDAPVLSNEGGTWACVSGILAKGSTPQQEALGAQTYTCSGKGGYEGLSAVLVSTWIPDAFANEFVGLIFSGEMPPVPTLPTAP